MIIHEYFFVAVGVFVWELEQQLTEPVTMRERFKLTVSSLLWGAVALVFDDEILGLFHITTTPTWWTYVALGFFIDILKDKVLPKPKDYGRDTR